ncbi:class I SAM-dependent methyltransferase [Marivita sp. S6314]|uniref:class I SAM-dependent methyltransferase n=1 Tax=Marivita sp. S6314 TaxID=2926406 RepID=UPI001FF3C5BE|nr:class I SAM-dependent methyltransferase [Marivita sp. S6314]MCK0149299.1 class I SAM-dependent methyltransferase [Marivita sp. S6314]
MTEVDRIVQELTKTSRRNTSTLHAASTTIDGLCRDYQTFMMQVSALRVREEATCSDRGDLLSMRHAWGEVTARTGLFQQEINRWREYRELVHQQIKPKRTKLYHPDEKLHGNTLSQTLASDDIFDKLHAMINPQPQSDAASDHACFPDIGLSNSVFHQHLHAAYRLLLAQRRQGPIRFLDVGCGAGLKVYTALRYFDEAQGFDFDAGYVEAGKRFLALDNEANAEIFEQDALTYDSYADFDVIYFYRPARDFDVLSEMEDRIVDLSKPGTVLIAPYERFSSRFEDLGCGQVDGHVYLSHTSQRQADVWRRKAELIGQYVLKDPESPLRTIWSPIADVSRQNGYDLRGAYKKPRY